MKTFFLTIPLLLLGVTADARHLISVYSNTPVLVGPHTKSNDVIVPIAIPSTAHGIAGWQFGSGIQDELNGPQVGPAVVHTYLELINVHGTQVIGLFSSAKERQFDPAVMTSDHWIVTNGAQLFLKIRCINDANVPQICRGAVTVHFSVEDETK